MKKPGGAMRDKYCTDIINARDIKFDMKVNNTLITFTKRRNQ